MSVDAIRWAFTSTVKPASTKFVLVSMADRADESHQCYPSIERISQDTGLDRKTVVSAIHQLREDGLIKDTGSRKGSTGRVRVYELIGVSGRDEIVPKTESFRKRNHSENGTMNRPKNGTLNSTENGTLNHKGNHQGTIRGNGRFTPPSVDQVREYCREKGYTIDPAVFVDWYESKGWYVGKNKMRDWKAAVRTWEGREKKEQKNDDPARRAI